MSKHIPGGVWELFVPGLAAGEQYKFAVKQQGGRIVEKSDPFGFAAELPPRTASIVTDLSTYTGQTRSGWTGRDVRTVSTPRCRSTKSISAVGSVTPRIPARWLSYRELAPMLVEYCHEDGLHASAAAAGQRASLHRKLGLPDGRILRRHEPLRHARRTSCTSSTTATSTGLASSSIGCRPISRRTTTACGSSTARRSTSTKTRVRANTPTGER